MSEHTTPAIASLRALAQEIATAREQLAALVEEMDFELWELDTETDLIGLTLAMADWSRRVNQAARRWASERLAQMGRVDCCHGGV